jgi:Fur family ferric uptake transcriptional regulator
VHFICTNCDKTFCLDDVTVPDVKLPQGFTPSQAAMVVTGLCMDCKTS